MQSWLDLAECEAGATAIEYALILGLISLAIISAVTTAGNALTSMFDYIANGVTSISGS